MKENIIQERSYLFALRIVKLYRWLCEEKILMQKCLLRTKKQENAITGCVFSMTQNLLIIMHTSHLFWTVKNY
jgi:hypothetical protein